MFKKIIWALLEVATIGGGTYIFVYTMVGLRVDREEAGLGAFLIVLGFLLRNWRLTLFLKHKDSESSNVQKSDIQNRSINTLLILIIAFSIFILNRKINDTSSTADSNESEIQDLVSRTDAIEDRIDNLETFEERIEDLENYSHSHY